MCNNSSLDLLFLAQHLSTPEGAFNMISQAIYEVILLLHGDRPYFVISSRLLSC